MSASVRPPETRPIVEPAQVPEFFVTGLADIEQTLGIVRASFFAEQLVCGAGVATQWTPRRRIVQVRLFCPLAAYPRIVRQATELIDPDAIRAALGDFPTEGGAPEGGTA